jgi:hypothetical protein
LRLKKRRTKQNGAWRLLTALHRMLEADECCMAIQAAVVCAEYRCSASTSGSHGSIDSAKLLRGLTEGTSYEDTLSVLRLCYEDVDSSLGFVTSGHKCTSQRAYQGSDLLYGEVLPKGVTKALDSDHLDGRNATVCFELGMGTGKIALQAWLQYENLKKVVGIELAESRYMVGEIALLDLVARFPDILELRSHTSGLEITIAAVGRTLSFRMGDMLLVPTAELMEAEVIFMEVVLPHFLYAGVTRCMIDKLANGSRIMMFDDLRKVWVADATDGRSCPFHRIKANESVNDRFSTSFGREYGTHLHLYERDDERAATVLGCANWVGAEIDYAAEVGDHSKPFEQEAVDRATAAAEASEALALFGPSSTISVL